MKEQCKDALLASCCLQTTTAHCLLFLVEARLQEVASFITADGMIYDLLRVMKRTRNPHQLKLHASFGLR
jgi:hypothetical protein